MDWYDVLPDEVAKRHRYWERRYAILAMRKHGYTLEAIGNKYGLTYERIRTILLQAERERRFAEAHHLAFPMQSPLERYLSGPDNCNPLLQLKDVLRHHH